MSITDDNVERLNAALTDAGAGQGVIGATGTSFMTRHGRLEVVRKADAIGGYEGWRRTASRHAFEHLTIMVAAPHEILRSKEAAGREKDREALPGMRRSFEESGLLEPPD